MKTSYNSFAKAIYSLLLTLLCAINANAQTWDFSAGVQQSDIDLLSADAANWTYDFSNNRYANVNAMTNAALIANGQELLYTKGLLLSCEDKDQIRVDIKGKRFTLNNSAAKITIPALKKDMQVTIVACSSNKTTERSITPTNLTKVSGFGKTISTTQETSIGTVTEDGDVTLSVDGGYYFYSIKVVDPSANPGGDQPGDEPGSSDKSDNATFKNPGVNQMQIALNDGTNRYYNTTDVKSVDFDGQIVKIVPQANGLTNDFYMGSVKDIRFVKAIPTTADGEIQNNGVVITEAKGWLESAYVKFNLYEGAKSYNVYVKGGKYAGYTKIDKELVRNYGTYGRADVVGLVKASYDVKVVPVDNDDKEIAEAASEATGMAVENYDRSGFAFNSATVPGAYNMDGSLKDNAVVFYVTNDNFDKIQWTINKDAKGNQITLTGVQEILNNSGYPKLQQYNDNKPLVIRVIGKIDGTGFPSSSWGSSAEGLQIKGNKTKTIMPYTIEGIGDDATFADFGVLLRTASHVEVRNIGLMLFKDDGISIDTDNFNLWIHNLDFFYGGTGSDSDQAKGDGSLDSKGGQYCTYSYNHFWDSGKCNLLENGSQPYSYNDGALYLTYHHNWYDHSDSRHPRVRYDNVHIYNNYYDGNAKYGAGSTNGSSLFVEANYYRNCKFPVLTSMQGNDLYSGAATSTNDNATFSKEDGGTIKTFNNIMVGNYSYMPYAATSYVMKGQKTNLGIDTKRHFDAYEAQTRDEQVPTTVVSVKGGHHHSNFDTDAAIMYQYTADNPEDVPGIVTGWYGAGRLAHGDFKWTFNNTVDDTNYDVNKALKQALQNYKSSFVGFFE